MSNTNQSSTALAGSVTEKLHVHFDEKHVLHELRHYLPTQTPLKDFIHHNSMHALQDHRFYEAIFKAAKVFGYQVTLQLKEFRQLYENGRIRKDILEKIIIDRKGKEKENGKVAHWMDNVLNKEYETSVTPRIGSLRSHWKKHYHIDLDNMVQPLLFRILCSYLDQGISIWKFPYSEKGFLHSIRQLESNSYASFFKTKRAKKLLLSGNCDIKHLLKIVVGEEAFFEQYLFDQQFSHRGWSGMVCTVETVPDSLLDRRVISLHDLIVFELLMEIDALDNCFGEGWKPLCKNVHYKPVQLLAPVVSTELNEVFAIWQDAFEWSYYDEVLSGLQHARNTPSIDKTKTAKTFQALFCIDERECSIRRHIEAVDKDCETFGTPGFFGVEFYFLPENGKFYDKLCPAPVTPNYLIKEHDGHHHRKHEVLYSEKTYTFFSGFLSTLTLGFWAGIRLLQNLFSPKMSPAISDAFAHMNKHANLTIENKSINDKENNLQIGFTIEEMAARVEGLLRGIGLTNNFAPIIYVIAHGSSSANNPHHGAHDCGACSGRPGSVNARVFSFMANHPEVRALLQQRGISIPSETRFIGGLHDTAADRIEYYDDALPTPTLHSLHRANIIAFEKALDLNAKERSRRFASINTKMPITKVRKAILDRSVSMFEPRPELGHGTNTLCIIGKREMTNKLFLDRRAFLNSYDYKTDPEGKLLVGLMRPIGPVCGGINLEYYFSRVDNYKLGAGTKLPHNVMGLIGVANSSDGDLRPGLPLQMIEVHDPVRLLVIVQHFPEIVLKTIQTTPEMYEWYINEWVHIISVHPETGEFYYFRNGQFTPYAPTPQLIPSMPEFISLVESAKEMETNHIEDATKENLPVYSIQ